MPLQSRPAKAKARARCVFRVAAGPRVGYGHLMRARALAQCLDMDVAISIRGGGAARRAADAVAPLVADAEALRRADVLIVDDPNPRLGRSWIARARRVGVRSVSVHDDEHAHDADLVICGSLGVSRPNTAAATLHGVRFYLLDRRIAGARHRRVASRQLDAPHIVVALGGGQHVRRIAQPLVDAIIARCPAADIAVAAGLSGSRRPALRNARWLWARHGLTRALLDADVAVVAGGVTLYEACALGVPAVGLAVVPGQRRAIRAFAGHGAVIDAGEASAIDTRIRNAAAGVARLVGNGPLRLATSSRARKLVDGRGVHRVARRIRALVAEGTRSRA